MNKLQRRVGKAEYKPNCYILVSASKRDMKETLGEFRVRAHISFLYDSGTIAAEWEPEYGPIQVWEMADSGKEHYFYDFVVDTPLNWSQLAVENNELSQAFNAGDYDYIFNVLKDWAR